MNFSNIFWVQNKTYKMEQPELNPFIDLVNEFEKSVKVISKIKFSYNILYFIIVYPKLLVGIYNVEVVENKTNYDFSKKSSSAQMELNRKS